MKLLAYINKWNATKSQCNKLFKISNLYLKTLNCAELGNGE
jgi:hypothetical protein